jgi:hypothetical protein
MLRRLPSPFAIFAIALALLFGVAVAARGLTDSDYYWHIVAGRLIATTASVPHADPFSFTWGGQPWTMHEWFGELLMYWLVSAVDAGVATFIFGVVSIAGPLVLGWALVRRGVSVRAVAIPTILIAVLLISYATIRPQVISWLFLGILLAVLIGLCPGHRWRPWLLVPFFVLWANVHGLYVAGGGVLAIYVLFSLAGHTPMAAARGRMLGVLAACFLGSMLTPAGPAGLLYPLRYVDSGDWGLAHIAEWQSPNFHEASQLALLALIVAVLLSGMRRTPGWLQVTTTIGVVAGLLATRNAPVAAVLALPTLAYGLADRWPARARVEPLPERVQLGRRMMELVLAAVVVVGGALMVPRLPAVVDASDVAAHFPVAAVDVLARTNPDARVLTEYGWGGYVINRLYDTGGRVFVDGRNDMYSERILNDYSRLRNADDGWQQLLDRYDVQAILLPPDAPLVRAAPAAGWCEAHRDAVAVLLLQTCARTA